MDPIHNDHDDLLLYLIYQMDENSLHTLIHKYGIYNRRMLRRMLYKQELADKEGDCLAELTVLLLKAVYAYRPDKKASFATFYHYFVLHYVAAYRRRLWSNQGRSEHCAMSLDSYVREDRSDRISDYIPNRDMTLEGVYTLYQMQEEHVLRKLFASLNLMERQIVWLKLWGLRYEEIADALNIEVRKVEYVLAKVRKSKALID